MSPRPPRGGILLLREGGAELYETISSEKSGGVATISLNRPKVLNVFNGTLHGEIHKALNDAAEDEEVRCIVLRGEGRGF